MERERLKLPPVFPLRMEERGGNEVGGKGDIRRGSEEGFCLQSEMKNGKIKLQLLTKANNSAPLTLAC